MVKPGLKSRVAWICGGAYPAGHPSHSHRHNPCLLQSAKPLTFNSIKLKDLKEASKNGRKLLLIMNSVWVDFTMFTFREKNWTVYLLLQGIGSLRAVHSPSVMSNSLRPMNLAHQAWTWMWKTVKTAMGSLRLPKHLSTYPYPTRAYYPSHWVNHLGQPNY